MGVDVELYGENNRNLTQKNLDEINATMSNNDDKWERFMLDDVEFDIEGKQEMTKKTYIHFRTLMRYYGEGYERGNWVYLTGIINIMRALSGGKIYYNTDLNSTQENLKGNEFTKEDQEEIDNHFIKVQQHPYRDDK